MAGFLEGFSRTFTPSYQRAGENAQQQYNADREFGLRKQTHDAQMAEYKAAADQRARKQEAIDAYTMLDTASPEQQAQVTNTYGMTPGQMAAAQRQGGLQAKLASYDVPDNHELQNAPAPRQFTAASLQPHTPTEMQRELGLARISAAEGDTAGLRASAGNVKKIDLEGRRREQTQKLMAMKPQEIVQTYGERFNADPNAPLMIDFDEGSGKYMLVSRADGIQSQMLSPAEMTQALMGAWEAGNGDVNAGLEMMVKAGVTQRGLEDRAFERSSKLAGAKADAHFKGLAADNDAARTGIARAGLGLQRQQANKEDWSIVGPSDDGKSVLGFNKRSGQIEARPLPPGTNAQNLFPKITGERDRSMTKPQELQARAQMRAAGYSPEEIEQAITGVDMKKVLADRFAAMDAERKATAEGAKAKGGAPQPRVVPNRTPEQQAAYDQSVRDDQERAARQQQTQQIAVEARGLNAAAIRTMPPEQAAATLQRLGPALGLQQRNALELRAQGR